MRCPKKSQTSPKCCSVLLCSIKSGIFFAVTEVVVLYFKVEFKCSVEEQCFVMPRDRMTTNLC